MAEMAIPEDEPVESMSPHSAKDNKLQLPMSCDPPGPTNPPKRLVWIVSEKLSRIVYLKLLPLIPYSAFLPSKWIFRDVQFIQNFLSFSYIQISVKKKKF